LVGKRRIGTIECRTGLDGDWDFTLTTTNRSRRQQITFTKPDGTEEVVQGDNMTRAFLNSLTVAIPATVIPILIAAFAAYAFAWMRFPGRKWMFILVVALIVVPLQIALVPILRDYRALNLNGTFLAIWLAHARHSWQTICS
jgi:alpha-glucoside transport system permease protein